jgi:hypothetical protein
MRAACVVVFDGEPRGAESRVVRSSARADAGAARVASTRSRSPRSRARSAERASVRANRSLRSDRSMPFGADRPIPPRPFAAPLA